MKKKLTYLLFSFLLFSCSKNENLDGLWRVFIDQPISPNEEDLNEVYPINIFDRFQKITPGIYALQIEGKQGILKRTGIFQKLKPSSNNCGGFRINLV